MKYPVTPATMAVAITQAAVVGDVRSNGAAIFVCEDVKG
jgi:hypothetical protein